MIGNVWEWTMTRVGPYAGGPPLPEGIEGKYYVIRGGAYNTPDSTASPTLRGYADPTAPRATLDKTGFRCVMPVRMPGAH